MIPIETIIIRSKIKFCIQRRSRREYQEEILESTAKFTYALSCSEKKIKNSRYSIGRVLLFFNQKCFLDPTSLLERKKFFLKKWLGLTSGIPLSICGKRGKERINFSKKKRILNKKEEKYRHFVFRPSNHKKNA